MRVKRITEVETDCPRIGEPISWAMDLLLKGETYETNFYKKD